MGIPALNTDSAALEMLSLCSARIPVIGMIAVHHWFVIERDNFRSRWEVWQSQDAGGTSWGHLHLDLMDPFVWPHRDDPVVHQSWQGAAATELIERIETSPQNYPWLYKYHYWPGPNSNSYVQWVLQQEYRLSWKAAGKHYSRLA